MSNLGPKRDAADPVTTAVVRHSLVSAAELMRLTLIRTAFSPIIFEVIDFCAAIYDREVRCLAQGESLPLWMGTLDHCIRACVAGVGGENALRPGDVFVNTDGFVTGSHPQDMAIVVPAFLDDALVGYAAIKAHQLDLGGKHPYNVDTTDSFQEGVVYPGVRLFRAGELQEDLYRILIKNSRLPDNLEGDVNAVIAAARVGCSALVDIIEKHGPGAFSQCVEAMFDQGEAAIRRFVESIPDGHYLARAALDNDGIHDEPIPFEITLEIEGTDAIVDFTASPPEAAGPINCPLPTTISAARLAVISVAGRHEAVNEGHFRPIQVRTRAGTLFHPQPPAPIFLYFQPAMIAVEALHRALADVLPEAVCASSGGDLGGIIAWRRRAGGPMIATAADHPTGQGATAAGDGPPPMTHITCSGGKNTPAEVWETAFPGLLVERMELAQDSAGPGRHRGGVGLDIAYRALEADVHFTVFHERTKTPPWGILGGGDARPNAVHLHRSDQSVEPAAKAADVVMRPGDVLEVEIGGGGGYGAAAERAREAVHRDVAQGYVSEAQARLDYPHAFEGER